MAIIIVDKERANIIHKNIADEHTAIENYYNMMTLFSDEKDIKVIEEIISEELKHVEMLEKLAKRYSNIKPEH